MGEQYRGYQAERIQKRYYCINGHVQEPQFAAHVDPSEIPETIDCPNCGLPAGQDKKNPPQTLRHEPYKTHLAYVKERRTPEEAKALLDEAIASIRERRARVQEAALKQAKAQAARIAAAKIQAAKAVKTALAEEKAEAAAKAAAKKATSNVKTAKSAKPAAKSAPAKNKSVAKPSSKGSKGSVANKVAKAPSKAKAVKKSAPKASQKSVAKKVVRKK